MSKSFQIVGDAAQASRAGEAGASPEAFFADVNAYQTVYATWLRRRSEDIRIGMEAAQRLSECRDIAQATSIYSKWVSESVNRLQEELSTVTEQHSALGNQYMNTLTSLTSFIPNQGAQPNSGTVRRFR